MKISPNRPASSRPFRVPSRATDTERERFEPRQGLDLRFQLRDRAGRGSLIDEARFQVFDLVSRKVIGVLQGVGVEIPPHEGQAGRYGPAAVERIELMQATLQPPAPPAQRLVDRLGRRGESPLQDRERETPPCGAPPRRRPGRPPAGTARAHRP